MPDFVKTIVPKARGVGRVADNDKAIIVYFDRPLTDDEMRALSVIIDGKYAVVSEQKLDS